MNNLNLSSKLSINEMQEIQGGLTTVDQRQELTTEPLKKRYGMCLAAGLIALACTAELGPIAVVAGYATYASCYF